VTHDLENDHHSEILNFIRQCNLLNRPDDPVKIVYHPDFIASTDPLFGIDYDQFVRGCHLGIFPSRYEPWGYAPLECVALGIPAVTSDLAGFGAYVKRQMPDHADRGIMIVNRRHETFQQSAEQLAGMTMSFLKMERRDRISQRNKVESSSEHFDWHNLGKYYNKAHAMALKALSSRA
jgi:glycogen(starch) synthase